MQTVKQTIWDIVKDRVTPLQFRRLAALYGYEGPGMGARALARLEGRAPSTIIESRDTALMCLRNDWRLWAFWLLNPNTTVSTDEVVENDDSGASLDCGGPDKCRRSRRDGKHFPTYGPDDGVVLEWDDGQTIEPRQTGTRWESDAFDAPPDELEAYGTGWIDWHEGTQKNPYRAPALAAAWRRGRRDAREASRRAA